MGYIKVSDNANRRWSAKLGCVLDSSNVVSLFCLLGADPYSLLLYIVLLFLLALFHQARKGSFAFFLLLVLVWFALLIAENILIWVNMRSLFLVPCPLSDFPNPNVNLPPPPLADRSIDLEYPIAPFSSLPYPLSFALCPSPFTSSLVIIFSCKTMRSNSLTPQYFSAHLTSTLPAFLYSS